jgi:glycosyltransferase involved in cell wall biosynthesis
MTNRATRRKLAKGGGSPPEAAIEPPSVTRQRILFSSNAPFAPTGYGVQTAQVVSRMAADTHEVAIACNYGLQGAETSWMGGVKLYPTGSSGYSDDILKAHSQHWAHGSDLPSLVVVLFDVWALENPGIRDIPKIAAWAPVDHQPAPPKVAAWVNRPNVKALAMSRFAERMFADGGVESIYIPHAVEPVFQPTPSFLDADGRAVMGRDLIGVDKDRFVVMMNSANKGRTPVRKCFGENLLAFSIFAKNHPDAVLYLHTELSAISTGVDLPALVKACGIAPDQVRFVDQYLYKMNLPQQALAALYTAADVLLAVSAGEGFGVPVVEAQACGTRVIVSDWTAQSELVGDGWAVEVQPLWDPYQDAWFATPMIPRIVDSLEDAYAAQRGTSEKAVAFAADYDADLVYAKYWRPALEQLAAWDPANNAPLARATPMQELSRNVDPTLTIYIPTYRRVELGTLLKSIAEQWCDRIEVVISDNDPDGSAEVVAASILGDACDYSRRATNIGGDANILRGATAGTGEYVWIIGDDDVLLPGAIAETLRMIDADRPDRIIHFTPEAAGLVPRGHTGTMGTLIDTLGDEASLLIAATLISANVYRRASLDTALGHEKIETYYGHVYAGLGAQDVRVADEPLILCGADHAGHIDNYLEIYQDLITAIFERADRPPIPLPSAMIWNFVNLILATR